MNKTPKEPTASPPTKTYPPLAPEVEALVHEIIGQVAGKWTMIILDLLQEKGTLRFTQIGKTVSGISQKMLTQTLREMERDGLVVRTVHPVIPPHVDYALTPLGESLSEAFCSVWLWTEKHYGEIQKAREAFAAVSKQPSNSIARERR
ncbi:helix-turn-helix domain-containing protein [Pandoraea sp.]|uniref:winged helix-turn-helix transcriptional regulator n=1 Tax=Pandoraea sp. TaxID=1883445 RepID=UPI0011F5064F|nr:helix-turn-helix domain-containing protein [Pandoraea sp.]MDE2289635.1 helix-turn-helix transcriptional regulator [Burkholderiales bacterium]TAL52154.1 MAG: transcriptional regulator [Pandoraea sp.]TAM17297.1 MAG: transcriptional regulator [Pandoraea sp.]